MVLITNRQSNILQDIDSLHLFAQVVSMICKSLDEREIIKHAFELLSAFDEIVTLGYRENLTLSQIKTFLDMESHEERIQEIIARVCLKYCYIEAPTNDTNHRTKSLRQVKTGNEKPNSSRCNAKRWPDQVAELVPEPHHTPLTRQLHNLYRILMTATSPSKRH